MTLNVVQQSVNKLQALLEKQKDMTMDYTDFLTKIIDFKKVFKEEDIINAFNHLDSDNKGAISIDDISKLMQRRGEECTNEDAKELISKVDLSQKQVETQDVNPNSINEFLNFTPNGSDSESDGDSPKFGK